MNPHDDHIHALRALVRTLEHAQRQTEALLELPAAALPDRRGELEPTLCALLFQLRMFADLIGGILPPA